MNEADFQAKLGEKIKLLRAMKNMTQNELAIECNFEKASMSRIESGQANPTLRSLLKISIALDVNMSELFMD